MEQVEKSQKTAEKEKSRGGCCNFTSEETRRMFRMMPFCFDRFGNNFSCQSMMKNMGCEPNKKDIKNHLQ